MPSNFIPATGALWGRDRERRAALTPVPSRLEDTASGIPAPLSLEVKQMPVAGSCWPATTSTAVKHEHVWQNFARRHVIALLPRSRSLLSTAPCHRSLACSLACSLP